MKRDNYQTLARLLFVSTFILFFCVPASYGLPVFSDDFESGNLNNWTIGGRQSYGTNIADVLSCGSGNKCGHLYHDRFTEITMYRDFLYDSSDQGTFYFDMDTAVFSDNPPAANYYGRAGVYFLFLDNSDVSLGSAAYLEATTDYIFGFANSTDNINKLQSGGMVHYEFDVADLLSQITIDESQIANVRLLFETYSSTNPYPYVRSELWLDNVSTTPLGLPSNPVPEPATSFLFGAGILGAFIRRRRS